MAKERGANRDGQQGYQGHPAQRHGVALQRPHLDAMRGVEPGARLDGLLDHSFDESLGFGRVARAVRLHRAQQRRLQRRFVLLEIQGDLFIGDAPAQRSKEEDIQRGQQRNRQQHPGEHDGYRAEPVPLHQDGSDQEEGQEDGEDANEAAEREFQTPAPPHFRDDAEKIRRHRGTSQILEHEGPSRLARSR